ncbi:hypothetical protein K4L44_04695 [Halosquirtibacter laminarini]|uniref:Uncharacterized protein n=4 Tax=Halosquirtibacter laminarini TaxID=3374600 RepID=A0AC61NP87_9BACT|nr:hypothetical protein K4L44_17025 [Prolixibacteraceae bacterium]QZE15120.1 hypothetical protein K4L44_04630 [Prolixibacteraceae bacterium]QZE15125.1 hypothetical protein K4L44_04655 [Prolixibacteraceae bacterium]QZE15133.1 hypothetical protein K4L44_04695 [Prolixibacteraceae bacterium]
MSKKAHMFDLIEAQHNSGLSNIDYCKQNNIKLSVYSYWKAKYKKEYSKETQGFFVTLDNETSQIKEEIVITYPNGVTLQLSSATTISTLRSLIQIQG